MRIFKFLLLHTIILTSIVVIVMQYEKISEQENKLLLQQMEIHTLKAQIDLMNQTIMMNNIIINEKAISSKTNN
ncbi:MAG: hypothetical protein D8B52_09205 [Prevotella sp.]|nr:MAG: hypothetical protein D8B52_09205 [Prevotella sp.]